MLFDGGHVRDKLRTKRRTEAGHKMCSRKGVNVSAIDVRVIRVYQSTSCKSE